MKLTSVPEHALEAAALVAGYASTPLLDTTVALLLARSVQVAVSVGIFEGLAEAPLDAATLAVRCGCHPAATAKLLNALVACGYVRYRAGAYGLTRAARRWLLRDSPTSLRDAIIFQQVEERFIAHTEEYVRSGEAVCIHEGMSADDWRRYQRGMRSGANIAARELALRMPTPAGAREMLDIGGAHGYYAVALCRRWPRLRATIFDLPSAVEAAAPLLAREGLGERARHWAGDALVTDFGTCRYDVIVINNLVHHFTPDENRALIQRVARALRPGGALGIGELIRPASPTSAGQLGALTDLYFAVTSAAGLYSFAELAEWQRAAGLRPRKPIQLLTAPGAGLQVAIRPRSPA